MARSRKLTEPETPAVSSVIEGMAIATRTTQDAGRITAWPLDRLTPHPDNPRTVNTHSEDFTELVESIKANGVIEPLAVRELAGRPELRQVLSGHRRMAAAKEAGLRQVPVYDRGVVDDAAAYDIVAMGNLYASLTPLEEGRRAALWLDKYGQDAAAVASKLGKSASWVVQHAQIARGLSPEWQKAVAEEERFSHWTAGHLAVIAKLPPSLQAKAMTSGRNQCWSWDRMSVRDLEYRVKIDLLYLAKAPFDEGSCTDCVHRTDRQPLLWGETVEQASGDKARCLDAKCWQRKALRAEKDRWRQTLAKAAEKGGVKAEETVAISTVERPKWVYRGDEYSVKIAAAKKVTGRIVEVNGWKAAKEGAKGAVPAVVAAGRGKGSLKWVKLIEARPGGDDDSGGGRSAKHVETPEEKAQREAAERRAEVRQEVAARAMERICEVLDGDGPVEPVALLRLALFFGMSRRRAVRGQFWDDDADELVKKVRQAGAKGDDVVLRTCRTEMIESIGQCKWQAGEYYEIVELCGPAFGVDVKAIAEAVQAETTEPATEPGVCRICGCTEQDCSQCIEATGEPCQWADGTETICTRCICPVQVGVGECVGDGNCQACGRKSGQGAYVNIPAKCRKKKG